MAHDHGLDGHHHHLPADAGQKRLIAAIAVNVLLSAVQIGAGMISGSLALVADALHNLGDAGSLVVALLARRTARRPADVRRTFGHGRVEHVGALINATVLVVIGASLSLEAILRAFQPEPVAGWTVVVVAGVALVVDLVTAALTWAGSRSNLNMRAAFVHNLTDAFASLGVIAAGIVILLFGWMWADVVATLLIAGFAIVQGVRIARQAARTLVLEAPPDVDLDALIASLSETNGVAGIHHVHLWTLDDETRSFEAHVVVDPTVRDRGEQVKSLLRNKLHDHHIQHTTLELEWGAQAEGCRDDGPIVDH